MKIKEGGTIKLTLMPVQYQPISIESTFEIEKDVNEDFINSKEYEEFTENITKNLIKRLEKNIENALIKNKEMKQKYKDLIT